MKIVTSWDDGNEYDLRIAQLLLRYGIGGIFYIPTEKSHLSRHDIRFLSEHFEIGGHTVSHPLDMKKLSNEQMHYEVKMNKWWLENIIGKKITSFCYPRGRYNDTVIDVVKSEGFTEARTTLVGNIEYPTDMFRISTTVHVHRERKEYNGRSWFEFATALYEKAETNNSYYHLWGHSIEVEEQKLWGELEELFKYISCRQVSAK